MDCQARPARARVRGRGKRRPAPRPLPARGCGRQISASARTSGVPPRAERGARRVASELPERADLAGSAVLQDRAAPGKLDRVIDRRGLDQDIAVDQIFRLGVGAIMDVLAVASHNSARGIERISRVFDDIFFVELPEPRDPLLHRYLHLLGRARQTPTAAEQKEKFGFSDDASVVVVAGGTASLTTST